MTPGPPKPNPNQSAYERKKTTPTHATRGILRIFTSFP
jgi:hypothetical protein